MTSVEPMADSILTGNVDTLDLSPADYSLVTSAGGSHSGPEGRWGLICAPEDDRRLSRVGLFETDPCTIEAPLEKDELMFILEGQARVELDDGSAVDLGVGDVAILPKGKNAKMIFKTRCKELFVTAV